MRERCDVLFDGYCVVRACLIRAYLSRKLRNPEEPTYPLNGKTNSFKYHL